MTRFECIILTVVCFALCFVSQKTRDKIIKDVVDKVREKLDD